MSDDVTVPAHVATPGIVVVAKGTEAVAIVLSATATLGRTCKTASSTVEVDDDRMSREHATVRVDRGQWVIADQDSRNGTFVNGQRIAGEVRRRGDTVVRCGHSVFVLLGDVAGHAEAAAHAGVVVGPELGRVYDRIRRASASDTMLITGEPGTGKATAARVFHGSGPHKAGPFVAVSCSTFPEGVAERLLFGGKKGVVESIGHFQMAKGGTILLDDIATLPGNVQAKLRRLIEKRQIETPIDVGIVATGHTELRLAVADGRFDSELYKRIAQVTIQMPPLRERKVDIARLVQAEVAEVDPKLAPHAKLVEACCVRPWPGNVRELRAAVRKAALDVAANKRDVVRVEDLDPAAGLAVGALAAETAVERGKKETPPADMDKAQIEAALVRANGVVHLAARILGIHRSQLYELMDKHGIVFTEAD